MNLTPPQRLLLELLVGGRPLIKRDEQPGWWYASAICFGITEALGTPVGLNLRLCSANSTVCNRLEDKGLITRYGSTFGDADNFYLYLVTPAGLKALA